MSTSYQNFRGGRNTRGRRRNGNSNSNFNPLTGGRFIPTEMPPVIVTQPWNSATVMFQRNTSSVLNFTTFGDLKKQMRVQLGFTTAAVETLDFDVRIESISMWANADKVHIVLYPANFIMSNAVEFSRVESHGQKNMFARVGFRFPAHISATPMSTSYSSNVNICGHVSTATSLCEMHIKILWKGASTALAIPHTTYDYVPICNRLRELADDLEEIPPSHTDFDPLLDLPDVDKEKP